MTSGHSGKQKLAKVALKPAGKVQSLAGLNEPNIAALKALSEQHGVPGIDLTQVCIRLVDLEFVPKEIAESHGILPVLVRDDRIFVAMLSPSDKRIIDELEFVTGRKVYAYVALPDALKTTMALAYAAKLQGESVYVAPRCPHETLVRMGLASDKVPARGGSQPEQAQPDAIVDDATEDAADVSHMSDDDFPNMSQDLSGLVQMVPEGAQTAKRTILIVDDEADIRKLLRRWFVERGFEVIEADRGLQALRIVKEKVPNVIVLDAMLPEVHGFEIARRIKGSQRYGHIPIVMISAVYKGWRYAEDVKSSYGVHAYIEKPFKAEDVLRAVESALQDERADAPAEPHSASTDAERALSQGVTAYESGDVDNAIGHMLRGIAADPLAYRLHFHLGLLFGKKNQVFDAIQHLEKAVDINARHYPALKNLAVLYQKAGFRNKAIETWERAIPLAPDDATKQSIKELLMGLL